MKTTHYTVQYKGVYRDAWYFWSEHKDRDLAWASYSRLYDRNRYSAVRMMLTTVENIHEEECKGYTK